MVSWPDGRRDEKKRNHYGDRVALLAQLRILYRDGRTDIFAIGPSELEGGDRPDRGSEIYPGETYNARQEKPDWSGPGYDDARGPASAFPITAKNLVASAGPPVRRIQEKQAVRVIMTPGGETVVDLGQNMVGWVRLKAHGPAATTITLRHAEVLDRDGNFYIDNLRAPPRNHIRSRA